MNLLLDTHVWIWSQERPEQLGRRAAKLLVAAEHTNSVCTPLGDWVADSLAELAASTVPVTHEIAIEAYALPGKFHRDPADRLLVAAARCHGLTLVTADDRMLEYPEVRSLDARR